MVIKPVIYLLVFLSLTAIFYNIYPVLVGFNKPGGSNSKGFNPKRFDQVLILNEMYSFIGSKTIQSSIGVFYWSLVTESFTNFINTLGIEGINSINFNTNVCVYLMHEFVSSWYWHVKLMVTNLSTEAEYYLMELDHYKLLEDQLGKIQDILFIYINGLDRTLKIDLFKCLINLKYQTQVYDIILTSKEAILTKLGLELPEYKLRSFVNDATFNSAFNGFNSIEAVCANNEPGSIKVENLFGESNKTNTDYLFSEANNTKAFTPNAGVSKTNGLLFAVLASTLTVGSYFLFSHSDSIISVL